MFKFLRKLFQKKQPKKILEIISEEPTNRKKTHSFEKFSDTNYCKIMSFHSERNSDGLVNMNIAWRTPNKVQIGDVFILRDGTTTKTLRIKKILDDKSDVKLGVARSLQ
jgi:hypothetical protein